MPHRAVLWGIAVLAVLDVLMSLRTRRRNGWQPHSVVVVTGNSANTVEGIVRCLLLKELVRHGPFLEVWVRDAGSCDETPQILELMQRDGLVSCLSPADPSGGGSLVLDLREGLRGREEATNG